MIFHRNKFSGSYSSFPLSILCSIVHLLIETCFITSLQAVPNNFWSIFVCSKSGPQHVDGRHWVYRQVLTSVGQSHHCRSMAQQMRLDLTAVVMGIFVHMTGSLIRVIIMSFPVRGSQMISLRFGLKIWSPIVLIYWRYLNYGSPSIYR